MRMPQWMLIAVLIAVYPLLSTHVAGAQIQTFEGHLKVLRADNFVTGVTTTTYYLIKSADSGGQTLSLRFPNGLPNTPLATGDEVTVQGELMGERIEVHLLQLMATQTRSEETVGALSSPEFAAAYEDRRAVILIINLQDADNSLSVSDVAGFMYTGTRNVNDLFKVSSFQQVGFNPDTNENGSPDIFGPYTIDYTVSDGCREDGWASAANAAAEAAGVDLSIYQHKVYALPSEAACGWSGLGSVGCSSYFCSVWVRDGNGPVFAHELGHNLGWRHASTDPENDGTINSEYGDRSGVMGYPYWSQVNAPHRDQRQWFDAFPGSLQVAQTSGTFELHALELDPGADNPGTQVVKIRKADTDEDYYLSYRRRIGDYPVYSAYADKINIHRSAGPGHSSVHLTNLAQSETFSDNANNITFVANATGGETASVTVTIAGAPINQPPSASFSYSVTDLNVQFTDASNDSDGTIAARAWNFGDGQTSNQTHPAHSYGASGTYSVTLVVTDDDGATDTAIRSVTIGGLPDNEPPSASFSFDVHNLRTEFTDTSNDTDGTIAQRAWKFGDGNTSTQPHPTHTYASPGTYTVTLAVTDNYGASSTTTQSVTTNMPPVVDFTVTVKGRQVSFTQSCRDTDGTVQTYAWDFGDGEVSTSADPVHTYATEGSYTVTLTVQDNDGASATISGDVDLASGIPSATPTSGTSSSRSNKSSSAGCFIQGLLDLD